MEIPTVVIEAIINQLRLALMLNTSYYEDDIPKMKINDDQDVDVLDLVVSKLFPDYEDIISGSVNVPVMPNSS